MSGTPRRINTDRSLGTPTAGSGAGGSVPPRPPVRPQGPAPQEDDGQSFFRMESGEDSRPAARPVPQERTESRPAHSAGGNGGGKEPPRHTGGSGGHGGGRKRKRRRSPIWLPLAVVLGVVAFLLSTAGGMLGGVVMCKLTGGKVHITDYTNDTK